MDTKVSASVVSMAAVAQSRSSIGTGSSSPAMATSIVAFSNRAFVPKSVSTVGTDTLAFAATDRMVVAA